MPSPVPGGSSPAAPRRDADIAQHLAAARSRLAARAGLTAAHYHRPVERPFTASEREQVTILYGGLATKHDRLILAVFEASGYRAQALPQCDLASCQVGKQFCNNGLCNPAYFTIGTLVRYLQELEASGLSRPEILDRYVFFTASSCGPCRFGMYEAEYRLALRNAGFDGFRILLFKQEQGVKADTGEPGLKLSLHFGLSAANALTFADALQAFGYEHRPFEVSPGSTDAALERALEMAAASIAGRRPVRAPEGAPPWLYRLGGSQRVERFANAYAHLYGPLTERAIADCRDALSGVEVDRLRVKPVVKVTGEFWAQTTETDGNFRMFEFLEREGAHVLVEPIGGWVTYLLEHARLRVGDRRGFSVPDEAPLHRRIAARWREERAIAARWLLIEIGERMYLQLYDRLRRAFGVAHGLADQRELARLADRHYRARARGGEGHLEVAKNIYYAQHAAAHMVLSLKPFGCMPSTQSDGVQAAVVSRVPDMIFVPIETGAEGALTAHSRVQMALVEARRKAQSEFDRALASTGRSLDEIREYVAHHPQLRRATYKVPHRKGIAGTAAAFVLHVHGRMRADGWRSACLEGAVRRSEGLS